VHAIHSRLRAGGNEDPDEPHACAEPLTHLLEHFTRPVAGRKDLGDPVRRDLGVALFGDLAQAVACDERDVRGSHRVGITSDLEARVLRDDLAQTVTFDVVPDPVQQSRGTDAVARAGRLAHDQDAAHEFRGLAGLAETEEVLRRLKRRWRHG
jgi:hypothetical protein